MLGLKACQSISNDEVDNFLKAAHQQLSLSHLDISLPRRTLQTYIINQKFLNIAG